MTLFDSRRRHGDPSSSASSPAGVPGSQLPVPPPPAAAAHRRAPRLKQGEAAVRGILHRVQR
jgi:hypothetical protein